MNERDPRVIAEQAASDAPPSHDGVDGFSGPPAGTDTAFVSHLAEQLNVGMIMTPRSDWVYVDPTDTVARAKELMGARFDQLPVLSAKRIVGLLTRTDCRDAEAEAVVSGHMTAIADLETVKATDDMATVVGHLKTRASVFVSRPGPGEPCGLLHYSDLNRHVVRIFFYLWLSALEMGLARLVERCGRTSESWLHLLAKRRQEGILERYKSAQEQGVELHPVEGAELSDLLKITKNTPEIMTQLGLSKTQFDKKTGHLIQLRNAAMHPVRSVVQCHRDVAVLGKRLGDLVELFEIVSRCGSIDRPRAVAMAEGVQQDKIGDGDGEG